MMLRMNRKEHFVAKVFLILPPPSSHPFFTLHTLQLRVAKNVAVRWKKVIVAPVCLSFSFPRLAAARQGIESALPESVFSQKSPKLLFEPRQAKQSRQSRAKIKSIEPFGARSLKYRESAAAAAMDGFT